MLRRLRKWPPGSGTDETTFYPMVSVANNAIATLVSITNEAIAGLPELDPKEVVRSLLRANLSPPCVRDPLGRAPEPREQITRW